MAREGHGLQFGLAYLLCLSYALSFSLYVLAPPDYLLLPTFPGHCNPPSICSAFLSVVLILSQIFPWLFSHTSLSTLLVSGSFRMPFAGWFMNECG